MKTLQKITLAALAVPLFGGVAASAVAHALEANLGPRPRTITISASGDYHLGWNDQMLAQASIPAAEAERCYAIIVDGNLRAYGASVSLEPGVHTMAIFRSASCS